MENPFLQLVLNRVETALKRLERTIWIEGREIPVAATACLSSPVAWTEARTLPLQPVSVPEFWGRLYQFRWFRLQVPPPQSGRPRYLSWHDQSQGTAWANGCPYHGFDHFHRRVRLPDEVSEVWIESVCLAPFIGPKVSLSAEGSRCEGGRLWHRNDSAWEAYHRLSVLFELAVEERFALRPEMGRGMKAFGCQPALPDAPPLYRRLLRHLDRCVTKLEVEGVEGLLDGLDKAGRDLAAGDGFRLRAILSGHAHIDLVWLWPERVGIFKARHSFANVLRLMDDFPEFRFQYSQGASYGAVFDSAPAMRDMVRKRIAEGRWEASGALEVESDTQLPCGEALARSFQIGQEGFRSLTGHRSRLLWLPDVFGYAGCLPQLMKAFGVEYFFTTKLSWNAVNPFPYSSFRWRGTDGSEIVAHLTQEVGYNNSVRISEVRAAERSYRQSDVHDEFLLPTGYGDGGGGPTAEMCERARFASRLSGLPAIQWDVPIAFFDRLSRVKATLPLYDGELYFENHRGTYTTQGAVKAAMRHAERALQTAEAAQVVCGGGPLAGKGWERVVFAQFHDCIPGTSVPSVYRETVADLSGVAEAALGQAVNVLTNLTAGDRCHFNPHPLPLPVHLEDGRILDLPPLRGCSERDARPAAMVTGCRERLCNGLVQASLTEDGELSSLTVHGKTVHLSEPAVSLWLYRDLPALHESWDLDRQALDTGRRIGACTGISQGRDSDGSCWVGVDRQISERSTVRVVYRLRPERTVLEIELELDWHEENALLRLALPTEYRGQMARYGSPFGSTLRPQKKGDVLAEAMWEVPGSRYAIVLDDAGSEGLFLAAEAKYGFSCAGGLLALSLVRSPLHTGMDGEDYDFMYPRQLRPGGEEPRCTDQGRHAIRLAIGRFEPTLPAEAQPAALAETLFTPALPYIGKPVAGGFQGMTSGSSLIPCWAQPLAPDDWLLRLHEVLGCRGEAVPVMAKGWQALRCEFDGSNEGGAGKFSYRAYEIVTLRLRRTDVPSK